MPEGLQKQKDTKRTSLTGFYHSPVLEELYLQDNRLVTIPATFFHFPSLAILDISNNKLQELPFDMWNAPKLRELNIAFNLLKDLPVPPEQVISLKYFIVIKHLFYNLLSLFLFSAHTQVIQILNQNMVQM